MSQAKDGQVVDTLTKGLMNFAQVIDDREIVQFAGIVLRDVRDVFFENIKADNICLFAFPAMILRPEIRVECFVAILDDRVIVAWRKGLFRKKTVSQIIPKHAIKQASWAVINRPGVTRGNATMLTITADETINIVLPKDKPDAANAILLAIQAK